jgi:hypothetical protein
MGQDKNSLVKTPHGFTVGIDSTQRSFSERSRARLRLALAWSRIEDWFAAHRLGPIVLAIFVL